MTEERLASDDRAARNVLTALLDREEPLRWAGRPRQGVFLRKGDLFLCPFSLLWGGFAIFWEAGVINTGAPWFFAVWGVPFVLIGLYLIAGRFFADAWLRSRTYYGVTDRRVIIHRRAFGTQTTSLDTSNLQSLTLEEYGNSRATIRLGNLPPWGLFYDGMPWPGQQRYACPSLEQITDGKSVYELLRSKP